jgi:hypothetical protein
MLDSIRIIIAGIKNRGFVVKYAQTALCAPEKSEERFQYGRTAVRADPIPRAFRLT